MKRLSLSTQETPEGGFAVTATTSLNHLMEVYESKRLFEEIISRMADRIVEENYPRIANGINFEALEASVLDLVKKKFADMLKVEEPKKSVPSILYSREADGSLKEIRRYGSGSSGG